MASLNYSTPGVYSVKVKGQPMIRPGNIGIAGMVGTCKRGDAKEPFLVSSWSDCVEKISGGLDSPFSYDSYLAFAAQSFFRNGGSALYISRACTDAIAKASCEISLSDGSTLIFEAKDEGEWGNTLKIWVTENELVPTAFDVHIQQGENTPSLYSQLTNVVGDSRYFKDFLNVYSNEVNVIYGDSIEIFDEQTFSGGDDGEDGISDSDYLDALQRLDSIDEITLLAIPGQTSLTITNGILSYLRQHEFIFGALDAPVTYKTSELKELRKKLSGEKAVLLSSWHRISDPMSNLADALRPIPSSGAYLGIAARIAETRGAWKDPAGTDCLIDGAVDLVFSPQKADTDILNPLGIVCIVAKRNVGICIWGARTLSVDSAYQYVSAAMLDIFIRKNIQESCQNLVFEPNKASVRNSIRQAASHFLDSLRVQGAFASMTAGSAYFVKCDEELNPPSVVEQGYIICRCGYAYARPGEFIVFEFQNTIS